MKNKISIGSIQPLAVKWISFLLVLCVAIGTGIGFVLSDKPGHWIGVIIVRFILVYAYFRTLNIVNIYLLNLSFLIEHTLHGTFTKKNSLYKEIKSFYFYYKIVFSDGTQYYFYPSLTGVWQSFIKDSQGYSSYVRTLIMHK